MKTISPEMIREALDELDYLDIHYRWLPTCHGDEIAVHCQGNQKPALVFNSDSFLEWFRQFTILS